MNILIVGAGKVGFTIAEQLCREKHNVTIIDTNAQVVEDVTKRIDVMGVVGNGATYSVLKEAGVDSAELLIAVTNQDELNLLCCMFARKAGNCKTIARVRNPQYRSDVQYIKDELGLSLVLNPEYDASLEISRILRFPSANRIDTFAKGRVELLKFTVEEGSVIENKTIIDIAKYTKTQVLICAVERGDQVFIPNGAFIIRQGDVVRFIGQPAEAREFFNKINIDTHQVKSVMIAGGGRTAYYLAERMIALGASVKIIERDRARCEELSEKLPKASIICADATNQEILQEEGISSVESFVATTAIDEGNIFLSLYAKQFSKAKIITKINHIDTNDIVKNFNLGSIITPKNITSDLVLSYVRARNNSKGSNVETLYRIVENKVEALEFKITGESPIIGVPLENLKLKKNMLIGCVARRGKVTIASGKTVIQSGDSVIVITSMTGLNDIKDILE